MTILPYLISIFTFGLYSHPTVLTEEQKRLNAFHQLLADIDRFDNHHFEAAQDISFDVLNAFPERQGIDFLVSQFYSVAEDQKDELLLATQALLDKLNGVADEQALRRASRWLDDMYLKGDVKLKYVADAECDTGNYMPDSNLERPPLKT